MIILCCSLLLTWQLLHVFLHSRAPSFLMEDSTFYSTLMRNLFFSIQIEGLRTKAVIRSTDCKAPWDKLWFIILSCINKTILIWLQSYQMQQPYNNNYAWIARFEFTHINVQVEYLTCWASYMRIMVLVYCSLMTPNHVCGFLKCSAFIQHHTLTRWTIFRWDSDIGIIFRNKFTSHWVEYKKRHLTVWKYENI